MQDSILGPWRDAALIILIIPALVTTLIPGVIFYFAIRGMRWVNRHIKVPLLTARVWALRIQLGTERDSRQAVELPIAVETLDARMRATVRGLADFLGMRF
jgi:hypothetical protein